MLKKAGVQRAGSECCTDREGPSQQGGTAPSVEGPALSPQMFATPRNQ